MTLEEKLKIFASTRNFLGRKGPLCVALVITDIARKEGLPLKPADLLTDASGQVKGLGKSGVQNVLKRHGIERTLAAEGGRTSRGSIGNMKDYVAFLNGLSASEQACIDSVEEWWVGRVCEFFSASPLKLKLDFSSSIRTCFRSVIDEAAKRQTQTPGATTVGAVMQHLVGAKLEMLYPDHEFEHNGYSVADVQTGRAGDFHFGETAIHVTNSPSVALMEKCRENLDKGLSPLIISSSKGAGFAEEMASGMGLDKRVEVLDIEQFLVTNLLEWSSFSASKRRSFFADLIERYNQIVTSCETDPSLRIELA